MNTHSVVTPVARRLLSMFLLGLTLALLLWPFSEGANGQTAFAQGTGPLAQYGRNIHQWHIVARYYVTTSSGQRVQVNGIQTVTATAVKSTPDATFWLVEPQEIDPAFYYNQATPPNVPRGTPIQFFYFVDTINPSALVSSSPGVAMKVIRRTPTYALLQEKRGRGVPELPIATEVKPGDAVVVVVLTKSSFMSPGRFQERSAKVTSVQAKLFTIDLNLGKLAANSQVYGAPAFVQREGKWKLAGIFVDHGASPRSGESAIARLPALNQLIPQGTASSDKDGDGVPDNQDRCPNLPGDPANGGCPDPNF